MGYNPLKNEGNVGLELTYPAPAGTFESMIPGEAQKLLLLIMQLLLKPSSVVGMLLLEFVHFFWVMLKQVGNQPNKPKSEGVFFEGYPTVTVTSILSGRKKHGAKMAFFGQETGG